VQNATQVAYQESLNKAIGFIEKNLDRKILLKDIAQEAFLSEYHFQIRSLGFLAISL